MYWHNKRNLITCPSREKTTKLYASFIPMSAGTRSKKKKNSTKLQIPLFLLLAFWNHSSLNISILFGNSCAGQKQTWKTVWSNLHVPLKPLDNTTFNNHAPLATFCPRIKVQTPEHHSYVMQTADWPFSQPSSLWAIPRTWLVHHCRRWPQRSRQEQRWTRVQSAHGDEPAVPRW